MQDYRNCSDFLLEEALKSNIRIRTSFDLAAAGCSNRVVAIEAEIERRKVLVEAEAKDEPDYDAWEPKWRAFCAEASWISPITFSKAPLIRALIAAHNTPLAREWTEYRPLAAGCAPSADSVSVETHDIEVYVPVGNGLGRWLPLHRISPKWDCFLYRYRYRPKQS